MRSSLHSEFPSVMSPPNASAGLKLSYPIYAADFDPHDDGFLLVGGGGGEGHSGVDNMIVSTVDCIEIGTKYDSFPELD